MLRARRTAEAVLDAHPDIQRIRIDSDLQEVRTGWEGGAVLVNDPAAAHAGEVGRRYRLDELQQVWLGRAGVGYVLFTPSTSPTDRSPRP